MLLKNFNYPHIWFLDTEYNDKIVVCLCAIDLKTGQKVEIWLPQEGDNPFDFEKDLFVSYNFTAEANSFLRIGWGLPRYAVDLMVEFRILTNVKRKKDFEGKKKPQQSISYLSCCKFFNIPSISSEEKEVMRDLILSKYEFNETEQEAILRYCWTDINPEVCDKFIFNNELEPVRRGIYQSFVAKMENFGIPLDKECVDFFHDKRSEICDNFVRDEDKWGVYKWNEKKECFQFNQANFEKVLKDYDLYDDWPKTLKTRTCQSTEEAFNSQTSPIADGVGKLMKNYRAYNGANLLLDENNCSYFYTQSFKTDTGRNAPVGLELPDSWYIKVPKKKKRARFIYSLPKMFRGFIKCPENKILAYLDYSGQEFGVAAALSQDENLIQDYTSGDPYISLGKRLGYVPPEATKQSHPNHRDRLKVVNFVMCYGGGVRKLSEGLVVDIRTADSYFLRMKEIYKRYFKWQQEALNYAYLQRKMLVRGGWSVYLEDGVSPTQIKNWLIQSTGGEILRSAIMNCMAYGLKVLAPIHDAILFECEDEQEIIDAKEIMEDVSEALIGLRIRVGVEKTKDRFIDDKNKNAWEKFLKIKENLS